MVAFNPRFLQCSECQQPQNYLRLYTTTGFSSGLRGKTKKKVKILGFSLLSIIFSRFFGVSENNPAMEFYYCAYCCLCLSECIFSWVESQVLRAGSKGKKWRYILCYINVEKFLLFFFPVIFPPLLKVTEVSINFYWNVLGVLWNAFNPNPPRSAWEDGGVERYISLFCLSPPPPFPFPILRYFPWKELVRTSRDGVICIVGGEGRVLSKLFNVPFPSLPLSLLKSIQRLLKSPLLMEQY